MSVELQTAYELAQIMPNGSAASKLYVFPSDDKFAALRSVENYCKNHWRVIVSDHELQGAFVRSAVTVRCLPCFASSGAARGVYKDRRCGHRELWRGSRSPARPSPKSYSQSPQSQHSRPRPIAKQGSLRHSPTAETRRLRWCLPLCNFLGSSRLLSCYVFYPLRLAPPRGIWRGQPRTGAKAACSEHLARCWILSFEGRFSGRVFQPAKPQLVLSPTELKNNNFKTIVAKSKQLVKSDSLP
ncbi:hypothetical protein BaRGS_00004075 [Batillaria attramentaria]|uniref:Uncharacterized protein n=1 Tax=Batillaria attramentaria TaxID=370345 RepID=A0ABD0LY33_9CAEN